MFHLVSPSLQISLVVLPGCRVASVWVLFVWGVFVFVWLWVLFLSCVSIPGRFSKQSLQFPVVDRPCLVLVRHCRKKKITRDPIQLDRTGKFHTRDSGIGVGDLSAISP